MPLITPPVPDDRKFRELILYIARASESDPGYGHTKLNKLLFYCEFLAYGQLGKAISWQPFQKLRWGPAAKRLIPIQNDMIADAECEVVPERVHDYFQQRVVARRPAILDAFNPSEVQLVDEVLRMLRPHGAAHVSEISHRFIGWRVAREREIIPYETVLIGDRPLTAEEKAYARQISPARE